MNDIEATKNMKKSIAKRSTVAIMDRKGATCVEIPDTSRLLARKTQQKKDAELS